MNEVNMPAPQPSTTTAGDDPYAAAREDMIERQLRHRGVVMHNVLAAMRTIPRHLFVSHEYVNEAYDDEALPSQEGQTISQPFMVGIMTQELNLLPGLRVLEIGTGTGYQTAVLATLVGPEGMVFTIEQVPKLTQSARHRLEAMEIRNVEYLVGDGSAGWPPPAPGKRPQFDRILVTAGSPHVPQPLLDQLADRGILVIPQGSADSQMLTRVERRGDRVLRTSLFSCRFVPLVGAHAWRWVASERQKQ
jgi:protein-L-isoaspartate(D-aspartate) O-methyltransferase